MRLRNHPEFNHLSIKDYHVAVCKKLRLITIEKRTAKKAAKAAALIQWRADKAAEYIARQNAKTHKCPLCSKPKPIEQFYRNKRSGLPMDYCKTHHKERCRRWTSTHMELHRQYVANTRKKMTPEQLAKAVVARRLRDNKRYLTLKKNPRKYAAWKKHRTETNNRYRARKRAEKLHMEQNNRPLDK